MSALTMLRPTHAPTPDDDTMLTVKDVARITGLDYKYCYKLIARGTIPRVQREKGCAIQVRLSTLRRVFPERTGRYKPQN